MKNVTLNSWSLRPGLKHLDTVRRVFCRVYEVNDSPDPMDGIKAFDFNAFEAAEMNALIELCVDGSNFTKEEVEALSPADFFGLALEVVAHNGRPLLGLSAKVKALKNSTSTQP